MDSWNLAVNNYCHFLRLCTDHSIYTCSQKVVKKKKHKKAEQLQRSDSRPNLQKHVRAFPTLSLKKPALSLPQEKYVEFGFWGSFERSTRLAPVLHGTVWGRSSVPVEQLPALSDFKARAWGKRAVSSLAVKARSPGPSGLVTCPSLA